jgi:N-acetylmuramoyl-L-alanine amidase
MRRTHGAWHAIAFSRLASQQFDILNGVNLSVSRVMRLLLISGAGAILASPPLASLSLPVRISSVVRLRLTPVNAAQLQLQGQSSPISSSPTQTNQKSPAALAQTPSMPQQVISPAEHEALPIVILDPAHGGADAGARGPSGLLEKDLTLLLAGVLRAECEREGFHVILTRDGDQDPSFDDRAAIANLHHSAIFISLHVSSTGPPSTVRTYIYPAVAVEEGAATNASDSDGQPAHARETAGDGLLEWDRAQQPFVADSRKLGDLIQVELSQRFSESPELSTAVLVRDLRSVAAPAVAVEISSVDVADAQSVRQMIPVVAAAIARGVSGFGNSAGGAGRR